MDDYQVDDLFEKHKAKKKKIDSGKKGDRGELEIVHLLNKRFAKILSENSWGEFSKSSGSGNRWAQVKNLPQHAKATYSGDITIPTNCLWVFESKTGMMTWIFFAVSRENAQNWMSFFSRYRMMLTARAGSRC
jgi:hypothetical protein